MDLGSKRAGKTPPHPPTKRNASECAVIHPQRAMSSKRSFILRSVGQPFLGCPAKNLSSVYVCWYITLHIAELQNRYPRFTRKFLLCRTEVNQSRASFW